MDYKFIKKLADPKVQEMTSKLFLIRFAPFGPCTAISASDLEEVYFQLCGYVLEAICKNGERYMITGSCDLYPKNVGIFEKRNGMEEIVFNIVRYLIALDSKEILLNSLYEANPMVFCVNRDETNGIISQDLKKATLKINMPKSKIMTAITGFDRLQIREVVPPSF